jgi:erythronate-4-phosphate dehydrogenase
MKIIADRNIPYVQEAFSRIGDVILAEGRKINQGLVKDADVLLVRTVTPVNAALLENSKIRFVGTATIGFDHVDANYLKSRGIGFANAAGCNANSVAEYIVAGLLSVATGHKLDLSKMTLGVVGVGNVGRLVVTKAQVLGLKVLKCDPPRRRAEGDGHFVSFSEIVSASDIISFHVPLTMKGEDSTYHMCGSAMLAHMKRNAFIFNTSRGAVVDGHSLGQALKQGRIAGVLLDVWEGEPLVGVELLKIVDIGTPHIAGYSLDGKANATMLTFRALVNYFGLSQQWQPSDLTLPEKHTIHIEDTPQVSSGDSIYEQEILLRVVKQAYDIERDDAAMRHSLTGLNDPQERAKAYDALRHNYPLRREFPAYEVKLSGQTARLEGKLKALGFKVTREVIEHAKM